MPPYLLSTIYRLVPSRRPHMFRRRLACIENTTHAGRTTALPQGEIIYSQIHMTIRFSHISGDVGRRLAAGSFDSSVHLPF